MLNARGKNVAKSLANSFGFRILKFSTDDVMHLQITRRDQNQENFYNALNKAGFQYKTLESNSTKFSVKLWAKGEKPTSDKKETQQMNKNDVKGLDRSSYIRTSKALLRLLATIKTAKDIPVSQLSFEQNAALENDQGRLETLRAIKNLLSEGMKLEQLATWIDNNIKQTQVQINMLRRGLKKSTQQFEAPKF